MSKEKDDNKKNEEKDIKEVKENEKKEKKEEKEEKDDLEKEYSKKIGDYILFEQIGQGTFSKVTRAFHIITEQIVAVKILDKQKIEDEIDIERIIREIEILRSISHPNISQMYETYSTVHNFYLMMEYIEGGDLFDFISDNCFLPEHQACYFFRQLISVMEYLAELGISHRDIKPENILLDKEHKNIKVIDFGLSNYCMEHELLHSSCGSPCYASPEMLSGNPYKGITTDLWSAGIVLYSMLVGALPFDDQELHKLYEQIKLGKFYIPSTLSLEAIDLLKRILQVDPKKRITIQELKEHKWYNIESNPMYKGVNIFYEHLPCDTKVVQYVMKKFFSEDQDISTYSYIKMIHMHACNKYTATYYLTKKYILKIEDKLPIRKTKKKQINENKDNKDSKDNKENKENNDNSIKESNNKEENIIKESTLKENKEKDNTNPEIKIIDDVANMDDKNDIYSKIKKIKNDDNYDNDININENICKINNYMKEKEKENQKKNEENVNNFIKEKKDINDINECNNIKKNKKMNNTRNIKCDVYDSNIYKTNNTNNTNISNHTITNNTINNNTNHMDKYIYLTLEEDPMKKTNLYFSKDKNEIKQEFNNSNKIDKKINHKKMFKQVITQTNDKKNKKETIQKNNNFLLTEQCKIRKNKNNSINNKIKEKIVIDQNNKRNEKVKKKSEYNTNDTNTQLKIGLSLINIKNISDKYKMTNESNTDRNITKNKIYSPHGNYTLNTIYKNNFNKKEKKANTYMDKIISPKKGDLNFYVINNIINKNKQEKKKNTKSELFNLEIKSNINKKNFISTHNNENIIVNINNNNYINSNINRNQCHNLSIDNNFFRTQEFTGNDNTSKDKNFSSQIKVNLKSSKGEFKYSNSPEFDKEINKIEPKNEQKNFEIEIFSNKIKNINKGKQRKSPSPFSLIQIQDNKTEGLNIIKFNNNYFNNFLGQSTTDKGHININLSSSQNRSDNHRYNNVKKTNIYNKNKLYKERIKKMIINHKKGKSLYSNCLESNSIFNYFKGNNNKKNRKNNHQRNVSSVLKYQVSDFRNENKGLNVNLKSNTQASNELSSSKNKTKNKNINNINNYNSNNNNQKDSSINKNNKCLEINNTNLNTNPNITSYSKEKIISPKIIYQSKNNLQKKRLFLQNNQSQNNNLNSFVMNKLKKNKLMITTGNNKSNSKNNYLNPLNQSNSTNNHFLTDNSNHKLSKINSNDNHLFMNNNNNNNKNECNYISNLSLVLKNGINKNKKLNNNELIMLKLNEKSFNKKQKIINSDINNNLIKNNNYYK